MEFAVVLGPRMSAHMIVTPILTRFDASRCLTQTQAKVPHCRNTGSASTSPPSTTRLIVRRTFVSMSTPSESRLVYLEDLEKPSSQAAAASTNDEKPSVISDNDENAKTKLTPTSNGKRQRTLFDMFDSTPGQGSEAPSKKSKLAAAAAPSNRNKPSTASATGAQFPLGGSSSSQQALNSVPFSLSEYTTSLTEDQKRLLKLECETMGKSW